MNSFLRLGDIMVDVAIFKPGIGYVHLFCHHHNPAFDQLHFHAFGLYFTKLHGNYKFIHNDNCHVERFL